MLRFKHSNISILMQCFTHKSFSEKLAQQHLKLNLSQETKGLIKQQRQAVDNAINVETIDVSTLIKEFILQFNFQIFEYLGDSILNQTMAKYYYLQTALDQDPKYNGFFGAQKLHDLKTWATSNHWLASLFCEHFYTNLTSSELLDDQKVKARQVIKEIKEKLLPNATSEEILEFLRNNNFPLMPFNIDDTNTKYKDQMIRYQLTLFMHCFKKVIREENKGEIEESNIIEEKSKDEKEDEENFHDQQDCFVKIFSDSMEALFGGIFIDSGDFETTQLYILNMMKSRLFQATPRQDQERTKVLTVWNSKKYTYQIKISHTVEEKDGFFYVRLYAGKLEIRRCKFEKDKKRKVEKSYLDLRFYLENAYFKFEKDWLAKKNNQQPTNEDWIHFNNDFRKKYHPNKQEEIKKREKSIYKEACKHLVAVSDVSSRLSNNSFGGAKKQIIQAFKIAAQNYKMEHELVLQIENERASSSKIRELFNLCDIRQINTLSPKCLTIDDWVNQLSRNQSESLYQQMQSFKRQLENPRYQEADDESRISYGSSQTKMSFSTNATSVK